MNPLNGGMNKEDVIHIYNGILLDHKKEGNWVICRDADVSRICHTSEICQKEKNKYIDGCMWNLEKWYR